MSRINIVPIVEGQGDDASVRNLLWNIWQILGGEHVEVLRPIRRSRGRFLKSDSGDLENSIGLATLKLQQVGGGLILILVDAEDDCAKLGPLGPLLLERAKKARSDVDIACVIANVMFETWFVAAAESLTEYLSLDNVTKIPVDPESSRDGKGWIKKRMRSGHYSETVDQPRLTAKMDINLARSRSKSLDKLFRELQARLTQQS